MSSNKSVRATWLVIRFQNVHQTFGSPHRHSALLHDNFAAFSNVSNQPCAPFNMLEIGGSSFSISANLRRSIDRDENQLSLEDRQLHIGREKEIPAAALLHYIIQARLKNTSSEMLNKNYAS